MYQNNTRTNAIITIVITVLSFSYLVQADDAVPVAAPFAGNPIFGSIFESLPTITTGTAAPTPTVVVDPTIATTTSPTTTLPTTPEPTIATTDILTPTPTTLLPTTILPTQSDVPTIFSNVTTSLDCTFPADIDLTGDGTLMLRQIINQVEETVTVELEYAGEAWVSFGYSTTTKMIGSQAVIGVPDGNTVLKYNMTSYLVTDVTPLTDDRQTLMNQSIVQENGKTILRFTQYLREDGEVPVIPGQNTYIWAYGTSNTLVSHLPTARGGANTTVTQCLEVGETLAPTVPQTPSPTMVPVTNAPVASKAPTEKVITDGLDCSFRPDIDVTGDGTVLLRHIINPINETVTVQLEYAGEAWLSFGYSTTTKMIGSQAVIGVPDGNTVKKYNMTSYAVTDVTPLSEDRQTLMDATIVQANGKTILTFTQYLSEDGEVPVTAGRNTYIWAYGTSNTLVSHLPSARGGNVTIVPECLAVGETAAPTTEATIAPTTTPTAPKTVSTAGSGVIDLGNGRTQRSLSIAGKGIDLTFITDKPMETLTVTMVYAGLAYVSVAFSHDPLMPDSLAVMALPGDEAGVPQKWDMGAAKTEAAVVLAPPERQTLINATYAQNATHTEMTFTKLLFEDDPKEQEIYLSGVNHILWAVGFDNSFMIHKDDGAFTIDFSSSEAGTIEASSFSPNKNWWIVHGVCLAIAWVILVPLAICASILKPYLAAMPAGYWYRTHRNLNATGVLLTIFGFAVSVYLISDENGGPEATHFSLDQHHKMGLVIFLFAFLQAVGGYFRPSLPHPPEPHDDENDDEEEENEEEGPDGHKNKKSSDPHPPHVMKKSIQRVLFEYQHRTMGAITVVLGWINCSTGFDLYYKRFEGPELNAAMWSVVGIIVSVTIVLAVSDRCLRKK